MARRQGSQRIEYHGDIDRFLRQCSGNRGQPTDGSKRHRHPGHRHSGNDALHGNAAGALRDGNGIGDPIEPIGENDDICRLRRGARAPGPHGNADVCRRQRRGVVDAVADHHGWMQALLGCHRIDLVGWDAIGKHCIEIKCRPDGFGGIGPVAGQHDDPRYPGCPESLHGTRRLAPEFVAQQQGADRAAVDRHEDAQSGPPSRASKGPHGPLLGLARPIDQLMRSDPDHTAVDHPLQPGSHRLAHLGWNPQIEPLAESGLHNGRRDDMM